MNEIDRSIIEVYQTIGMVTDKPLGRGTRRRIEEALASGLSPADVARMVIKAAAIATAEERGKVGSFGGQETVFERLETAARMQQIRTRLEASRATASQPVREKRKAKMRRTGRGW